jgi:phenylpyruvate tautomerase PptA (4-oxalocrotonate tautomerase family)
MPMLDAFIPAGAISDEAENRLLSTLTDIVLRSEGADPADPVARPLTYVWLHRPVKMFAGGEPAAAPRYRIIASVPEGAYDDERRRILVAEVTEAVLDAEEGAYDRDPMRIFVFPNEVPEGTWGGGGRIYRLADSAGMVFGDAEKGRRYAERRLADRHRGEDSQALR